jgi:hypothetical protein
MKDPGRSSILDHDVTLPPLSSVTATSAPHDATLPIAIFACLQHGG